MRIAKSFFAVTLIIVISAIASIAGAEVKAEGTFTGSLSGTVKGSGRVSGPVSITINGKNVIGRLTGKCKTGDSFIGTISGTYNSATGALKATYFGSFTGMNSRKVPTKGSLSGKLIGTKFAGTWSGRGSGTWKAAGGKVTTNAPQKAEKSKLKKAEEKAGVSKSWFGCTLNPAMQ